MEIGRLYQNQPNPFKESTEIKYEINQENANASILIFDMQGTLIKSLELSHENKSSITVSGKELQPGMYLYSLIVNNQEVDTKRMIITN